MTLLHDRFLAVGTRIFAISIDSPQRNAAMVEKLTLPFPYLSDPDRSQVIEPYGVADQKDERNIARPAVVLIDPSQDEVFRFVSRDFADRMPEEEILAAAEALGLPSTSQEPPDVADPAPGPRSLRLDQLKIYMRGARFAALAMGLRHGHFSEEIKEDSKAYVAEMDRYSEAIDEMLRRS